MVEIAEIRRRVRQVIEASRRAAEARRVRTASASQDGQRVLRTVVAPVFKTVVASLKAEGYAFQVSTPSDAVRMAAEASSDNFIEAVLDTAGELPALRGRVSRTRGRGVLIDETVVCEGDAIGSLTEEDVTQFLLDALGPLVER